MSPTLEEELRATLTAHALDVSPQPHLADAAISRAVRLRRIRRLQVATGGLAVVGVVALVPLLAALGPADHAAPPVQPHPSGSAEPVPDVVMQQARETHALLATATTIVDGSGAEVVTVPLSLEAHAGFTDTVNFLSRAAGGYVVKAGPSLTEQNAPPHTVDFVRPDGSMTRLGNPKSGSVPVLSPDGSLVAFEATAAAGAENLLVVTDLAGHPVHQRNGTGPQEVLSLSVDGLWYACAGPACSDPTPFYWDFRTDAATRLAIPSGLSWAAQSGDLMVLFDHRAKPAFLAYDVTDLTSPARLWMSSIPVGPVSLDGSGTRLLVYDVAREGAVLLDATTGKELDQVPMGGFMASPTWTPDHQWLVYGLTGDGTAMSVKVVTPASDDTLTVTTTTYPPFAAPGLDRERYAGIGRELPPPQP